MGTDPQERLAALLARGYGDGPGGRPVAEQAGMLEAVDEHEQDEQDEQDEASGEEGEPPPGRGGRSGRSGTAGRHRAAAAPPLWSLPSSLREARRSVSWRAVAAVAVLIALAGAVLAVRVGSAQASAQPQTAASPPPLTRTGTPPAFATPGASGPSGASRSAAPSGLTAQTTSGVLLVVDVAGQVARPGLVRLPAGARVADALARAGGAGSAADLTVLNLARPLVDGERLYVPRPGEVPPTVLGPVVAGGGTGSAGGGETAAGTPGSGSAVGAGGPVDLNSADLAALDGLPGVGPVLAQRILDWRTQHGRFSTVDELGEVSGIGDKLLGTLRPLVAV
ncbi:hypothetical protein GCM10009814_36980 [Lapillicoccus jejuensis]|uniref:Competence protein ComEA n=1 Tax=Lapillicoccus jejuensis TaxID=402171 RepID=A0A542DVC6_9MICO|nr:competence protein ComEA [Lapillicoccus jejuensis]